VGFARGAEVEERADALHCGAVVGVGDGDDEFTLSGDEVGPHVFLVGVRGRVEGVVEEVAGAGDEVAGVEAPRRQFAGGGDGEFDED
jgi:hypothetical protein